DLDRLGRGAVIELGESADGDDFGSVEPERIGTLPRWELQRYDTHSDEVRAVNALEAFGDDGANPQQCRSLRGPVPARTRTVLLAAENNEGYARGLVVLGGVIDGCLRAVSLREVAGVSAFDARSTVLCGEQVVAEANVGE